MAGDSAAVGDEGIVGQVDEAYRTMYARYRGPLRSMLAPPLRAFTSRVPPR